MKHHDVTTVILAAGLGTRMKSQKAKVLHQAGGDTLLNHVIRAALHVSNAGRIVAVVGHQAAEVKASVRNPAIQFAEQIEQKGTGHAVLCARDLARRGDGWLMILNGDGPLLKVSTLQHLAQSALDTTHDGFVVTTEVQDATGYGRIVRNEEGGIAAIVEQKSATPEQLAIREINAGVYIFRAKPFWDHLDELEPNVASGEYYLTDMVEILRRHNHPVFPFPVADETELLGINTRVELAVADEILRARKTREMMLSGVTIENPGTVCIDPDVVIGPDTILEPGVQLRGRTTVGKNCLIGTGSILRDCEIGDSVEILPYVVAQDTHVHAGAAVGPFSRLRMHADVGEGARIGNFVELKKASVGKGAKANHLAYLGDVTVGSGSNIGAGAITCNYDGKRKHTTHIDENVFIGSNSTLVAPLHVGTGAYVAAGSVITTNVDADALALGRAHQVDKADWAKKRREKLAQQS